MNKSREVSPSRDGRCPSLDFFKTNNYYNSLSLNRKDIFIKMLANCNYREEIFEGKRIKRNQLVVDNRVSTAKRWGVNPNTLRSTFDTFCKDGIIEIERVKSGGKYKFSIITVLIFDGAHSHTHINEILFTPEKTSIL